MIRCQQCNEGNHGNCLGRDKCGCACAPGPRPMLREDDVRAAWRAGRVGLQLETLRLRRQGTGPKEI